MRRTPAGPPLLPPPPRRAPGLRGGSRWRGAAASELPAALLLSWEPGFLGSPRPPPPRPLASNPGAGEAPVTGRASEGSGAGSRWASDRRQEEGAARWVDRRAGRPPSPLWPDAPRASRAGPRLQGRARWVPQAWAHPETCRFFPGSWIPIVGSCAARSQATERAGAIAPPHQDLHLRPAAPEQQWSRVCPAWTLDQSQARDTGSNTSSSALCPRRTVSHCPLLQGPGAGL